MSAVIDTLKRVTGRKTDVVERLEGLNLAVEAARGRLDPTLLADAEAVVERAGDRLRLSSEHTIVALAGATGSGKSSLFNALAGLDLAAVGVKRPTTSWALACSWGPAGATELLDWLGIPKRHQVDRTGVLDASSADTDLRGLVLLDLPDHDSTEVGHHLEVERLVKLTDVLLWVLDPQKYADAAIHDRFLKPFASYADVMMVTLNHIDEIPASGVEVCLNDARRLLALDGLGIVPVLGTSATRGDGLDELREALAARVAQKSLARERLTLDVKQAAHQLSAETGSSRPVALTNDVRDELAEACSDAAGVPVVVDAVEMTTLLQANRATGWPVTAWVNRFKPDPMRKLGLGKQASDKQLTGPDVASVRHALPAANSVQRARVDAAVRAVADRAAEGMSRPWATAVRAATTGQLDKVTAELDKAVTAVDLGMSRRPAWWGIARILQWVLFLTALAGAVWLVALAAAAFLQLSQVDNPSWSGLPIPTILLVLGVAGGLLLAWLCRVAARSSARRRARDARARLTSAIETVTDRLVIDPLDAEIDAYLVCQDGLLRALKG